MREGYYLPGPWSLAALESVPVAFLAVVAPAECLPASAHPDPIGVGRSGIAVSWPSLNTSYWCAHHRVCSHARLAVETEWLLI
jgi:hypothetical protein